MIFQHIFKQFRPDKVPAKKWADISYFCKKKIFWREWKKWIKKLIAARRRSVFKLWLLNHKNTLKILEDCKMDESIPEGPSKSVNGGTASAHGSDSRKTQNHFVIAKCRRLVQITYFCNYIIKLLRWKWKLSINLFIYRNRDVLVNSTSNENQETSEDSDVEEVWYLKSLCVIPSVRSFTKIRSFKTKNRNLALVRLHW